MKTEITFPYKIPMLNGSDGLIRAHYHVQKKQKQKITQYILAQTNAKYEGRVIISITRYSVIEPDIDNLCASFKHIGDALVKRGVILDDKPSIIAEFKPSWEKAKNNKEQKTVVTIEPYKPKQCYNVIC